MPTFDSNTYEIVPLPTAKARNHDPIWLTFRPDLWPDERFELFLFWNPATERYMIQLQAGQPSGGTANDRMWADTDVGVLLPWSALQVHRPYLIRDYLRVILNDPTNEDIDTRLRARDLGDPLELMLWPGPEHPDYEPYEVTPDDVYDPESPPEPWAPALGYEIDAKPLTRYV